MTSPQTLANLIRVLVEREVRFVLIGGLAVAVHGHPRATRDVDIVFDTSPENAANFAKALAELGAKVLAADTPEPDDGITAEWLADGGHFVLATDSGPLDALSASRGQSYADLAGRAVKAEFGEGLPVLVCSYEDLVAAKEAAGRAQDLADLEGLREVREDEA